MWHYIDVVERGVTFLTHVVRADESRDHDLELSSNVLL